MTELYTRDFRRLHDQRMPPMPYVYLYPEIRARYPELPPRSVVSVERSCQLRYRAKRYAVSWVASETLPMYRYPTPFPVPSQDWYTELDNGRLIVNIRIASERFRLRLRGGRDFQRQFRALELIHSEDAVRGEVAIYKRRNMLMLRIVAWFPIDRSVSKREGVLFVKTDPESLLVGASANGHTIWQYAGDHVRRWVAAHRHQLQRWNVDSRHERGRAPSFAARRTAATEKFRDRMNTAIHQITASLVHFAEAKSFATVCYDDARKTYCEQFPWMRLRSVLAEKLRDVGIGIEISGANIVESVCESDLSD